MHRNGARSRFEYQIQIRWPNLGKYDEEKEKNENSCISNNETIESPILNIVKKRTSVDLGKQLINDVINQAFNIEGKGACTGLDDNDSSNHNVLKKRRYYRLW